MIVMVIIVMEIVMEPAMTHVKQLQRVIHLKTRLNLVSRNTAGNVPLEWYKDEEHIGYDLTGKKIKKKERQNKLDSFLASVDDSHNWRKIYDDYNDEEVELTKEETWLTRRLLEGKAPLFDFDPYGPYVDWFAWDGTKHPFSNAPEPKRHFVPSKWESKLVLRYVRAIRKEHIKFNEKPKEEPKVYALWDDATPSERLSCQAMSNLTILLQNMFRLKKK